MRAGALDRTIEIQRPTEVRDEYGVITESWAAWRTARAQIIQRSTAEYLAASGVGDEAVTIFRMRWIDGLTAADRVAYDGTSYDIKEIKEIGRRKGLDLRCVARSA